MSASGPSRRFAARQDFVRYRDKPDLANRPLGEFMGSRPNADEGGLAFVEPSGLEHRLY